MKKIETSILDNIYLRENYINEEEYNERYEWNIIKVYPYINGRKWIGMGGSITESSCYNFSFLPQKKQEEFLESYFGVTGLNYNLGRISIASNDFCISPYEYTKKKDLSDFSIERDRKCIIPVIKRILNKKNLSLVASPWSPPKFMKDNKNLFEGGKLQKKYYALYAKYLIKFLDEYKKEGIDIEFITIQNEPFACQRWESCIYTLDEQEDFIYNYFIKLLEKENYKLLLWDHNKENLYEITKKLYRNKKKIFGIAYHSYSGTHSKNLELVSKNFGQLKLIHTEGCTGFSPYNEKEWIKDAEMYLIDIMNDMNNGMNAYIDWNILLDSNGGPNHKENYCKSPVLLNKDKNDFILTPIYYYISHISKFIKRGSTILNVDVYDPNIIAVSAKNNYEIVTVILNKNNYKVNIDLVINNFRTHDTLKPHSIVTYVK